MFIRHENAVHVICAGCGDSAKLYEMSLMPLQPIPFARAILTARLNLWEYSQVSGWNCINCWALHEIEASEGAMGADVKLNVEAIPAAFLTEHWQEFCAWDKYAKAHKTFKLRWPAGVAGPAIVVLARKPVIEDGHEVIVVTPNVADDAELLARYAAALQAAGEQAGRMVANG